MKKITEKSKHGKSVIMHLKRHHKKYLFGVFGGFALIKTVLVVLGLSPVLNIGNTFANEEGSLEGNLVRLTEPFYTRASSDYVDIHWLNGSNGGYKFNDSNNTGSVNWSDGFTSNDGSSSVTVNLTDQSHNGDYICAFAQTGTYSQTICSQYPIQIDATEPTISTIFPVNGQDLSDSNSIELSWSGFDNQSGLSGFLLSVSSPSGVSNYNLSSGQFIQNINIDSTGNRSRFVVAYDNVGRTGQASSYFVVNDSSNPDPTPDPEPEPEPEPDPTPQPEPINPGILVLFRSEPFYTRTAHDYVQIEWTGGGYGGYKFSSTNNTGSVSSFDYIAVNGNFVEVDLPDQSHNGEYICAFAWTDNESQTICTQYPIQVDTTKPTISTIFPISGQSFLKGESIELSWSGFDNQSGLSGFLLSVSSPSGVSDYNLSSGQFTKNIYLGSAGNRSRSVTAYDNVGRTGQVSSYFVVNNPSNPDPNTGNNPNQNITGNSFFLIRPTLFEVIELGNNITFRWNAGNVNNGYTWIVKKIGGAVISSGSTTGVSTTLNNGLFSVGSYSRSIKDIHANTEEEIPLFYVVDSENIPDLKVTNFEFNEIDDANIDEYYKSNKILIDGLDDGWYTFAYLKDNIGALFINGEFVGTQGLVTNGDNIRVELKASNSYNETVSTKLVVGSGSYLVSDVFKVTTKGGITGWDNSSLTPMQKLWGAMFVDSLVEMYQYDERKLATFLSTFMQILKDKSDYYAQEILNAQEDGDEELLDEYKLYKNAVDFLYTIVKYRYENIEVEDRTVYIAPNGKQYLVEYNEERRAYTSPDFTKPKYFPTWESFKNHIDLNNPEVGKRGIVGNVITTHNGKVYTIYETNGKWTSSNFTTKKYFDTKEDIINHILASNPASDWDHTRDTDFSEITYIAPSGKPYVIFKTSSKGNNPNMYSSYDFVNAKYFTSLEAIKKYIDQSNPKK